MVDQVYLPDRFKVESEMGAGGFLTGVNQMKDGTEQRVERRPYGQRKFSFTVAPSNAADMKAYQDFIADRRGMRKGFLFTNYADYQLTDELILTASGGETTAQIIQTKGSSNPLSRNIYYINSSTLVVKVNGATQSTPGDYSVNSTGLITFTSSLSASDAVTVTVDFYTAGRFDTDDFMVVPLMPGATVSETRQIPIIEIIEA